MAYCQNCGQMIDDKAVICVHCGVAVPSKISDSPSTGLKVLCFFFPIIGLILYLVKKDQTPISAKAYGKWALIGFLTGIVCTFVYNVLLIMMLAV